MILRLIFKGWRFRAKRVVLALTAFFLGASLIASLLGLYLNVNDKVGRELRSYGANIRVLPKTGGGFIDEAQLVK
ncbi:MAG: ABC transporter permease, partial [Desulfitobacteriaceae bacterium]